MHMFSVAGEQWSETKMGVENLDESIAKLQSEIDSLVEGVGMLEPQKTEIDSVDIDEDGIVTKHSSCLKSSKVPLQPPKPAPVPITKKKVNLPPVGSFTYPPLLVGQAVYAMRCSLLASWGKGCVQTVICIFFFTNFICWRKL